MNVLETVTSNVLNVEVSQNIHRQNAHIHGQPSRSGKYAVKSSNNKIPKIRMKNHIGITPIHENSLGAKNGKSAKKDMSTRE